MAILQRNREAKISNMIFAEKLKQWIVIVKSCARRRKQEVKFTG